MANLSRFNPFNYIADGGPERFAVGRVNVLLARIFSVGGLAVGLQMLLNAWAQRELFYPVFFWPAFTAVCVGQIGLIFGAYVSGRNSFWQRWYTGAIATVALAWPAGLNLDGGFPNEVYPWVWWGVGLSAISGFASLRPIIAAIYFVFILTFWFFARFTASYGQIDLWLNLQDTLLTFLFTSLLGVLIAVTRFEASQVDEASTRRIQAAADQAKSEAAVKEKSRLDSLVHDKVLTTLILAAKAESPEQKNEVARLAVAAITSLKTSPKVRSEANVNGSIFFAALERIALAECQDLSVSRTQLDSVSVPAVVADALTEAVLQAISNSNQHAGPDAARELHLKGHRNGLKIIVKDTGRGFRMSRVPKNRFGLRVSIIERVELVGGRVFIDSQPGQGTNIILEWGTRA